MLAFLKPFDGFEPSDFATYSEDKWSSNVHNLSRMQVKQKLAALAGPIGTALSEAGLTLDSETSTERPSLWNHRKVDAQWLYFLRDEKARKDLLAIIDRHQTLADKVDDPAHHHRHTVLAVRVDVRGVSVLCASHHHAWLDRNNLAARWKDPYEAERLLSTFSAAADGASVLRAGNEAIALEELDRETLGGHLAAAPDVPEWLGVERHFGADDPEVGLPGFAERLTETARAMAAVYPALAWDRDRDFLAVAQKVVEAKKTKRRTGGNDFLENDPVEIVGGLFAGRKGVVAGYDQSGKVKVRVGTLTLPVSAGALKRMNG